MLITFIYQNYLKGDNGKCRGKARRISFLFSFHIFVYGITISLIIRLLAWGFIVSSMGNKMKGIFKGFKYIFNNFVKERELEIGCPTDVKHVAHIGWDGSSGSAPSWMNQFKKGPDFAAASIGNSGASFSPWISQGDGESNGRQSNSENYKDSPTNKEVNVKKSKRRKSKATSSPKSSSSSRTVKSKTKFVQGQSKPENIEVA